MNYLSTVFAGVVVLVCFQSSLAADTSPAESGDRVEMKYDPMAREAGTKPFGGGACAVRIVRAVDARQNKETVGQSMNGALLADDVGPWMTAGLSQLKDFGFVVTAAPTADNSVAIEGVTIRMSVKRAYTWQIGLKIFSMLAVKAEYLDRNGLLQEKYYRAHGDKTNMWGAKDEYVTTLNYGLNNLLPLVARDLQSLCKGQKVESYSYAGPDGPTQ